MIPVGPVASTRHGTVGIAALLLAVTLGAGMGVPDRAAADVGPLPCAPAPLVPACNRWASRLPLGPANEVHVAVNPLDPNHLLVVAKDYALGNNGDCRPNGQFHVASASYVTKDGGLTWRTGRVPAPYPNGGAEPSPLSWRCGSDPVAAFGPDGTAYYILLNFEYTGGRKGTIAVARSPDGGASWPAGDVRPLHTSPGNDKEWGAVDAAGRVHVVWSDLTAGKVMYARSLPDFTFEAPKALANIGAGNPAVTAANGPAGETYVFWRDGASIKFTRSVDGGGSFEPIRAAFNTIPYETGGPPRLPFMPQLAVDRNPASPFAGRVYVVWPDAREGDAAVFEASSADGGLTWTAPQRVDDNLIPGRRQVMPTVSVAPNGRVDVAWLDQRDLPPLPIGPLGETYRAYASSSTDGAAGWSLNAAVSEVPLVAGFSKHQDGSVFIGDYMGIASTDEAAWPAFPGNGADRLLESLPSEKFQRADAYVAALAGGAPSADASSAHAAPASSEVVGDVAVFDPRSTPLLD